MFLAHNRRTNEQVAIKSIELVPENPDMKYLLPEVQALREFHHPNIVGYKNHYVTDQRLWIVMELVGGANLCNLAEGLHLKESEIATISRESLQAVDYLHKKRIVHRDIKGANVAIAKSGAVKLLDFGYAVHEEAIDPQTLVGTAHFMAPEIALKQKYGCSVDIWAFGIMLVQMNVGLPPYYEKEGMAVLALVLKNGKPKILNKESCSLRLLSFIDNCLHIDPTERSSANSLLKHDFLFAATSKEDIGELVIRYRAMRARCHR